MTGTHPVDQLMEEHRVIERVLNALEARLAEAHGAFPAEFVEQALDFFRTFADGCHHYKEEQALFPRLKERGVPQEGGPIGCMLHDHDAGRACLGLIRDHLEAAKHGSVEAEAAIREQAAKYIELLRQHILKEDQVLFQMAHRLLTEADTKALEAEFNNENNPKITGALRARYQLLAAELAGQALPQGSHS
jgi:hemerythrin-like domain-containing protein